MKFKYIALAAMFAGSQITIAQNTQVAASALTPAQTQEIQAVIKNYLLNNPEILVEVSQKLQAKQNQEMQAQASSFIKQNAVQLLNEKIAVAGAQNPNVTIVEFFDYNCGHCIKMSPVISELMKSNPQLRVIYRELPIFGEKSINASKAALAAGMQGKYVQMHDALFSLKNIDEKTILAEARKLNLNMTKFQDDMKSKAVTEELAANRQLAEQMKLMGTPVFIVMATPNGQPHATVQPVMIPGSTSLSNLQNVVKTVAEAK
ncbi:MAG: DsbA family protein [Pseudomonadota bacterium]|nr:DsbA family protein [Pseudomonadota bacterium]